MTSTSIYSASIPVTQSKTEKFISKAKLVHGDLYDYSLIEYIHSTLKIKIICPIHGEFSQRPTNHLNGQGCKDCATDKIIQNNTYSTEEFIKKATLVHGDLYNYEYVKYINCSKKIKIDCKIHGIFEQQPSSHLFGQGCKECGFDISRTSSPKSNTTDFIHSAEIIHGTKYNYSLVDYINIRTKVKIICSVHGEFSQNPKVHLESHGCPECGGVKKIYFSDDEKRAGLCTKSAKRRASKLKATPKWYELDLINQLYIDRNLISEMTGIEHHVDHIVPLQSDIVCGLHCFDNLRIISATENTSKGNRYWPDMPA